MWNMKKKLYIIIISILAIVVISSAFIPLTKKNKITKGIKQAKVMQNHPDAGYIEAIGN